MESTLQNQIDAALSAASAKVSQGGAVTTLVGWSLSSQFIALMGLVVAVLGFLMAQYYNHRRDQREQAEHEARMRAMERQ